MFRSQLRERGIEIDLREDPLVILHLGLDPVHLGLDGVVGVSLGVHVRTRVQPENCEQRHLEDHDEHPEKDLISTGLFAPVLLDRQKVDSDHSDSLLLLAKRQPQADRRLRGLTLEHLWVELSVVEEDTPERIQELYRNLTVDQLMETNGITGHYQEFLAKQKGRSHFNESLVVGSARIYHFKVVMAISDFYFSGGSMGVVFGEKFRRAADYAIQENLPFISLCCSGGARLYEGISALMQMVKTIESVNRLKRHGLPYISILADPSTGGAIASYAALGDIIIAEPGALVIFAGPRVMKSRGFDVDEKNVRADSLYKISGCIYDKLSYYHDIRGIQEICTRKEMKRCLAKYLDLSCKIAPKPKRRPKKKKARKALMF